MRNLIHYLPIATTVLALWFAASLFSRWKERVTAPHLMWWGIGALAYGAGTFTEASVTLFGWSEPLFRAWYITGALLGGAPLAQGTVYLLLKRRTAHVLTVALLAVVTVAAACVLLSPIRSELVEPYRLSGRVLEWSWVRAFSPFVNTYAFAFLVGGAVLSAVRFSRRAETAYRTVGNAFIAVGALLPGIGGAFTRFGHTEVLYVTELIGLLLIVSGYRYIVSHRSGVRHASASPLPAAR